MAGKSIADQLKELRKRQADLDKDRQAKATAIEKAAGDLDASRKELDDLGAQQRGLDADVEATARLETDLAGAAKARTEAHDLGAEDVTKAGQEQAALTARIDQELSVARRDALAAEIDKIDDAIGKAAGAADTAAGKLATAEQAAADAREAADAAAAAHADALRRLAVLPQRTEAARARVDALRRAATTAVDAGRMAEAFVRNRDLAKAVADLDAAVKDTEGDQLAAKVPELWAASLVAAAALASATAAVEPLREKADAARLKRDGLVAGREESIAGVLSKPLPGPP